jgi:hypothetical protein
MICQDEKAFYYFFITHRVEPVHQGYGRNTMAYDQGIFMIEDDKMLYSRHFGHMSLCLSPKGVQFIDVVIQQHTAYGITSSGKDIYLFDVEPR